jgi:hypothetical protein
VPKALVAVNDENRRNGLPLLEMGVGIHTGEAIVGNIGSERRAKYGVVGDQRCAVNPFPIVGSAESGAVELRYIQLSSPKRSNPRYL